MGTIVILLSLISVLYPHPAVAATIAEDCAPSETVLLLAGLQPDWPIGQCCTPSNTSASGGPRFFVFGCSNLNGTSSGNVSTPTTTTTTRLVNVSWSPASAYSRAISNLAISNVTEWRKFDLRRVGVTGTLPGINKLTKLQYLDLSSNPASRWSVENAIPPNVTLCNLSATRLFACSYATIPRTCSVEQCCGSDCAPVSATTSFLPNGFLKTFGPPPPAYRSGSSESDSG
ncbi:hypothetical protein M427DRAFT_30948 [Gonapodya prolifera JEL478]|uniref:L domain-like protein n=1 Tax=Gonapodya prolifera (strain JEL478) TaxID=1344416 RepID=A0A139AJB5_GONPJ|nr:hypothetical protein M427DRAFT_30948 [Gonapodya prolifera JEL478]|eukprot:KXS16839.1 hypothetical protein M427DRAFT_30948 [Gonapodya prolifera JEL478]